MHSKDPFQRFSVELAVNVLTYLDLQDLARCERVSRGWKDFVQAWMVTSGFRGLFPGVLPEEMAGNRAKAVRRLKEHAAPYCRLRSGKATCALRIEASEAATISGNFAVWRQETNVSWQRLDFREDGSLRPMRSFDLLDHGISSTSDLALHPNMDGYLIARNCIRGGDSRLSGFLLETGSPGLLWSLFESESRSIGTIVAVGRTRIYSVATSGPCCFMAHRVKSGNQIYAVQLEVDGLSTQPGDEGLSLHQKVRPIMIIVGARELLVCVCNVRFPKVLIAVIDGATGQLAQGIETEVRPKAHLSVAANGSEIALISEYPGLDRTRITKVQKFVANSAGTFNERPIEFILSGSWDGTKLNDTVIDPFHYIAAGYLQRGVPGTWSIIGAMSLKPSARENLQRFTSNDPEVGLNQLLTAKKKPREIKLPPKSSQHKTHRLFPKRNSESRIWLAFAGGSRLLCQYVKSPRDAWPPNYMWYLFDFGLRSRRPRNKQS